MSNLIEYPIVKIYHFYNEEPVITIHNYVNSKGNIALNKEEAVLLYLELHKFIYSFKSKT